MENRAIFTGERYRHYKGGLYQIVTLAMNTETEEQMVVYQALYGDFKVFVRPLSMFFDEVETENGKVQRFKRDISEVAEKKESTVTLKGNNEPEDIPEDIPEGVSRLLITFLDAQSCNEKLEVLHDMRKEINDKTIDDIAAAMDLVITEGEIEERIKELENCLKTRARYETMRLR